MLPSNEIVGAVSPPWSTRYHAYMRLVVLTVIGQETPGMDNHPVGPPSGPGPFVLSELPPKCTVRIATSPAAQPVGRAGAREVAVALPVLAELAETNDGSVTPAPPPARARVPRPCRSSARRSCVRRESLGSGHRHWTVRTTARR